VREPGGLHEIGQSGRGDPVLAELSRGGMSQGTVLVTAATRDTGRATGEQYLARGRRVRALAHREDATG
jgi:hypothetical protein